MKNKRNCFCLFLLILFCLDCMGCSGLNAEVGGVETTTDISVEENSEYYEITDIDQNENAVNTEVIDLEQCGTSLVIDRAGDYMLEGKNPDCNIIVNVYSDENVHLFLNNVELHSAEGPVILVQRANKVVMTAIEGTENTISDGTEYTSECEACIFSYSDLTLNGKGKISVYGYYHDAVRTKDRLKVINADVYVKAKNDAFRANEEVVVYESKVELESEGAGIYVKDKTGSVHIQGGECKIIAGKNAIYAPMSVYIEGCEQDLYAVQESVRSDGTIQIEDKS